MYGRSHGGTNAPGPQSEYAQGLIKWRDILTPGNEQVAMGQGDSSSTSGPGLGVGEGAYGVSL
jgi:hypothetical protein